MEVGDGDEQTMKLVPKELKMLQAVDLTLFKIEQCGIWITKTRLTMVKEYR